jgi:hypothetical protein
MNNIFKTCIFLIIFFTASKMSIAQDNSLSPDEDNDASKIRSQQVILSPLDPNMYLSAIDQEISEASNNINQREIIHQFRNALDKSLYAQVINKYSVVSFLQNNNQDLKTDHIKLFKATAPVWQSTPIVQNKNDTIALKGKALMREKQTQQFMNTSISEIKTYKEILKKYNAKYCIFINQFEIKNNIKDQYDYSTKKYTRSALVHYNVMDNTGKQIAEGIAKADFDALTNKIGDIIAIIYPSLSKTITDSILINKVE